MAVGSPARPIIENGRPDANAFVCDSPFVQCEVLLEGKATDDETQTLLIYVEGDHEACEEVLTSRPEIGEYDVTPESDDAFFMYVRGAMRDQELLLEKAFDRETVVVVPPIEFRSDRTMHLSLVGAATTCRRCSWRCPRR